LSTPPALLCPNWARIKLFVAEQLYAALRLRVAAQLGPVSPRARLKMTLSPAFKNFPLNPAFAPARPERCRFPAVILLIRCELRSVHLHKAWSILHSGGHWLPMALSYAASDRVTWSGLSPWSRSFCSMAVFTLCRDRSRICRASLKILLNSNPLP
jgi:hypothetical protein